MSVRPFELVHPSAEEVARALPGDEIVPGADVVMDRAFTLQAAVPDVWPWFVQLGKRRAGWYLPRTLERFVPPSRRGLRHIEPRFQSLAVGDVIPDWGGRDETFAVVQLDPPGVLVHRSTRKGMELSWAIVLREDGTPGAPLTRVHLRLRLGPVRRKRLAESAGGLIDLLTIAGLAAGLRDRLASSR